MLGSLLYLSRLCLTRYANQVGNNYIFILRTRRMRDSGGDKATQRCSLENI